MGIQGEGVSEFLFRGASLLFANALVNSRLDYCNSLFRSLHKFTLCKLQCSQIYAARIVSKTSRYTSETFVVCYLLNIVQCFKEQHLSTSFFKLQTVSSSYGNRWS